MNWNLPNIISSLRIVCMPLVIHLINGHHLNGFLLAFLFYQLSDLLDGYLARRLNQQTDLGHTLDAMGDLCSYIIAFWSIFTFKPNLFSSISAGLVFCYAAIIIYRLIVNKALTKQWFPKIENDKLSKIKFYVQSVSLILVFLYSHFSLLFYLSIFIGLLHEIKQIQFAFATTDNLFKKHVKQLE